MKNFMGKVVFGLGISFFFGYVIISVGLGSVCNSLYKVATPVICRDGQYLEVEQQRHSWRPGAVMWTATVHRVDPETGKKEDITTLAKLVSGAIYGLGIFVLLLPKICRKAPPPAAAQTPGAPGGQPAAATGSPPARAIDEKLAELKKLRESDLITAEDYEQKKAEILRGI